MLRLLTNRLVANLGSSIGISLLSGDNRQYQYQMLFLADQILGLEALISDMAADGEGETHFRFRDKVGIRVLLAGANRAIMEMLNASPNDTPKLFERVVKFFELKMLVAAAIIGMPPKQIQEHYIEGRSFYKEYQKVMNAVWLTEDTKNQIKITYDNLVDHQEVLIELMRHKQDLLVKALKKVGIKNFGRTVVGTNVALLCIVKMNKSPEHQNSQMAQIIAQKGYEYSEKLAGFTDTIDILCNPEEAERIRNADEK